MPSGSNKNIKAAKLYRSESNRVIAGVCGGLADYFGIDATILRVIFVFITLFGGSGIILYVILWVVVPSETTKTTNSEDHIKENVEELKEKSKKLAGGDTKTLLGIAIIIMGLALLLENLGVFVFRFIWRLWPIFIIIVGLSILNKKK